MRLTRRGNRYAVFDDIVTGQAATIVQRYRDHEKLTPRIGAGASQPLDGLSYRGRAHLLSALRDRQADEFETIVESVIVQALAMAGGLLDLDPNSQAGFTAALWSYPAGSQLAWHRDTHKRGAFAWYVHDHWPASWGGELLIVDQPIPTPNQEPADQLTYQGLVRLLAEAPDPQCVLPRPNRLVLLAPDTPHTIRRVDPAAGETCRQSLAGFFLDLVANP